MKKLYKYIFILGIIFLAQDVSASTCGVLPAGGNWNAAGTWHSCAGGIPLAGDAVVATSSAGNLAVNANTATLLSIDFTGYTGTLSGSSQIAVRGVASATSTVLFSAGMTVSWTGTLALNPVASSADIDLTTNGKLMTAISSSGSVYGIIELQDNLSFTAIKGATIVNRDTRIDMNGKTISGNSVTNRLLIQSSSMGTQRTIIIDGGTFANTDFIDIALDVPTDLSGITGGSGDCGGNSNITFTTAATQTWNSTGSGSWSDATKWTSRVPLCQDDVVVAQAFTPASRVVTMDMPRIGKSVDISGTTGNPSFSASLSPNVMGIYGSLTLPSNPANAAWSVSSNFTFYGRGSYTLTTGGETLGHRTGLNAPGGSLTLQNAITITGTALDILSGTFNANNLNVTSLTVILAASASSITNMGSGTWTVTGAAGVWSGQASSVLNADTSTIVVSNTTATSKTFAGAGKTFNDVIFSGDNITVTGANTFNNMAVNNAGDAGTNGLILTVGTATTTVTSISTNATTTADRAIIKSSTSGTIAGLLANTGGDICVDYMSIQDIRAYGTSSFYAGANSLDVSGNIGWTFSACPVTSASTIPHSKIRGGGVAPVNPPVKIRGGSGGNVIFH